MEKESSKQSRIKKKTTSHCCEACGEKFLTLHGLIEHMKVSSGLCGSFLQTCKGCGKHFAEESSLNRHLGQMASCRLLLNKADIASFVEYNPTEATTPLIIATQSAKGKQERRNIPKVIHFRTPNREKKKEVSYSSMVCPEQQKMNYHLQLAQTYLDNCQDTTDYCVRLKPSLLLCSSNPNKVMVVGKYDDYILKIVRFVDSTKDLCSSHGIHVLPLFLLQINILLEDVIDEIIGSQTLNTTSDSSSNVTMESQEISESDIRKFFYHQLEIFQDSGEVYFSLDKIPTRDNNQEPACNNVGGILSPIQLSDDSYEPETIMLNCDDSLSLPAPRREDESDPLPNAMTDVMRIASKRSKFQSNEFLTPTELAYMNLYDLLKSSGIAIGMFDQVQRWATANSAT